MFKLKSIDKGGVERGEGIKQKTKNKKKINK